MRKLEGLICVIVVMLIIALWFSVKIVKAGERGVLLSWGAVQPEILGEGLHFVMPVRDSVKILNVKIQKEQVKAPAFSKDLQSADAEVALNFHIEPSKANSLWQEIGADYKENVIAPAIQECVKTVTAKFNAQSLIESRAEVKTEILNELKGRLEKRYIWVDDVSIMNFDFSEAYEKAIENKQVEQQKVLTAENILKQRELEAKQRVATAEGEAKAIQIQAEAIAKQGGEAYIKIRAIDRWNGVMPTVITGGEMPFLPVSNVGIGK